MKRHYCTHCGRKLSGDNIEEVYYTLLKRYAYHCTNCMSINADIMRVRKNGEQPVFLELFSGSAHVAQEAARRGYETVTVDNNKKFGADITTDILKIKRKQLPKKVDVVWASVPCTYFSILNIPDHWERTNIGYRDYLYTPKTKKAVWALKVLNKTIRLIKELKPNFYFIENPRGALRHMPQMAAIPYRSTISYNDYGFDYFKPTDIFHNCYSFKPKEAPYQNDRQFTIRVTDLPSAYERSLIPPLLINELFDSLPILLPGTVGAS